MRKIYAIGETVLDIIIRDNKPEAIRPGGSMLNTCISLGRLGLPVFFMGEYSTGNTGKLIDNFLKKNGVDNHYVHHFSDAKTTIALAFLDKNNNAEYSFYRESPARRLQIPEVNVQRDDIVLFGSIFALSREIRETLVKFISSAKKAGALIMYDPNFRMAHINELSDLKPLITENLNLADIVRGSDEDFFNIFNIQNSATAYGTIREKVKTLVYTASKKGVFLHSAGKKEVFPVKDISPISTVGAGDSFNAGLVYGLYKYNITTENLVKTDKKIWRKIISAAVEFASDVCMTYDNYISPDIAGLYKFNPKV
ncbi:MAG: carbohydrate kinase family protein [Bacteroidales bacterium]